MTDPRLPPSTGDMFLMVKSAKGGAINGEAQDTAHNGEIEVLSWSWGMHARPHLGGGTPSGKAAVHELKVVKRIDRASTALMSALRTNELIVKAVLTLRKAGKTPVEYLKITIEDGRITALNIEAGDKSGSADLFEHISLSFNKITVEYTPQGKDGQPLGGTLFTDQFSEAS